MIGPMTYELGQGTGPLRGVKVVEIAGIGPGPHACMIPCVPEAKASPVFSSIGSASPPSKAVSRKARKYWLDSR